MDQELQIASNKKIDSQKILHMILANESYVNNNNNNNDNNNIDEDFSDDLMNIPSSTYSEVEGYPELKRIRDSYLEFFKKKKAVVISWIVGQRYYEEKLTNFIWLKFKEKYRDVSFDYAGLIKTLGVREIKFLELKNLRSIDKIFEVTSCKGVNICSPDLTMIKQKKNKITLEEIRDMFSSDENLTTNDILFKYPKMLSKKTLIEDLRYIIQKKRLELNNFGSNKFNGVSVDLPSSVCHFGEKNHLYRKILKLVNNEIFGYIDCEFPKEAKSFWFWGETGMGKTTLAKEIGQFFHTMEPLHKEIYNGSNLDEKCRIVYVDGFDHKNFKNLEVLNKQIEGTWEKNLKHENPTHVKMNAIWIVTSRKSIREQYQSKIKEKGKEIYALEQKFHQIEITEPLFINVKDKEEKMVILFEDEQNRPIYPKPKITKKRKLKWKDINNNNNNSSNNNSSSNSFESSSKNEQQQN